MRSSREGTCERLSVQFNRGSMGLAYGSHDDSAGGSEGKVVRGFVLRVNQGGLTLPEEVGAFPSET